MEKDESYILYFKFSWSCCSKIAPKIFQHPMLNFQNKLNKINQNTTSTIGSTASTTSTTTISISTNTNNSTLASETHSREVSKSLGSCITLLSANCHFTL